MIKNIVVVMLCLNIEIRVILVLRFSKILGIIIPTHLNDTTRSMMREDIIKITYVIQ